jgi:hypothetical protein
MSQSDFVRTRPHSPAIGVSPILLKIFTHLYTTAKCRLACIWCGSDGTNNMVRCRHTGDVCNYFQMTAYYGAASLFPVTHIVFCCCSHTKDRNGSSSLDSLNRFSNARTKSVWRNRFLSHPAYHRPTNISSAQK